MLDFAWDEAKDRLNRKRHGIAFADVVGFLDDPGLIERLDQREDYGEDRIIAFAKIEDRIVAIVYVERNDTIRLISARYATRDETDDDFRQNAL